jgi:hypothetical protein
MMVESSGQIWLLVSVASPLWKSTMAVTPTPDGPLAIPQDWTRALSSWIIVIDGGTRRVRYAARFREYLREFLPDRRALGVRGVPNKSESLVIFRIESDLGGKAVP